MSGTLNIRVQGQQEDCPECGRLYLNLNRFAEKIMVAKLDASFVKLLNQFEKVSLLILDDFGPARMDQNTRN